MTCFGRVDGSLDGVFALYGKDGGWIKTKSRLVCWHRAGERPTARFAACPDRLAGRWFPPRSAAVNQSQSDKSRRHSPGGLACPSQKLFGVLTKGRQRLRAAIGRVCPVGPWVPPWLGVTLNGPKNGASIEKVNPAKGGPNKELLSWARSNGLWSSHVPMTLPIAEIGRG